MFSTSFFFESGLQFGTAGACWDHTLAWVFAIVSRIFEAGSMMGWALAELGWLRLEVRASSLKDRINDA